MTLTLIYDFDKLVRTFVYYFEYLDEHFNENTLDMLIIFPDLMKFYMNNVKKLVKSIDADHHKEIEDIGQIKYELGRIISSGYWTKLGTHFTGHYYNTFCDENIPYNHQLIDKKMFFEIKDLLNSYLDEYYYINSVFIKILKLKLFCEQ